MLTSAALPANLIFLGNSVVDPSKSATVLPFALLLELAVLADESANSVLLTGLPLTDILTAVCQHLGARTLLLIVSELTFVAATIGPLQLTFTMPLALLPATGVHLAIREVEGTIAIDDIIDKATNVRASIGESHLALTLLDALIIGALIAGAIGPALLPLAVLLIV